MNLETLHTAIESALTTGLQGVDVRSYPDLQDRVSLPLIVLELSEFEPGEDPGTGELALIATLQARLVLDPTQPAAELHARQLAARLAAVVHQSHGFGQPVTPAKIRQIGPDGFRADLDGYLVWLVEWTHELHVGDPMGIELPAFVPSVIAWGFDPETGVGGQYEDVKVTP